MKKRLLSLFILGISFLIPKSVFAVSVSTSCSSQSSTTLGNTVSVTVRGNASDSVMWDLSISYDSSKLQLISGTTHYISDNFSSSTALTYKFRTIALGSAYVKVANAEVATASGESASNRSGSCNINIVKKAPEIPKSSDNNLKSLSIEGQNLSPEFNKDTLEYSVELSSDTEKIKVNAEKSDSKASIKGNGEIDVKEGLNKIEIIVTAENGSTKTYVINATVKEKDPINVKVDGKNYSVVRKLDGLKVPQTFNEKDVTINDETIKGCYNESLDYTLVALKDENNNIRFYIYNEGKNTYSKFNMISSADLNVIVLKLEDKDDIPYRYSKTVFNYNDDSIDGYSYGNTDFKVIYGINAVTGEEGLYQYDTKDNTIQRFFNEQTNLYINLVQKLKLAFIILGSVILIFTIIIIILLSKNVKFKKKYLSTRLNDIDEPNYNKIKYEDIEENKEELEEELSKKELKKLKKEEKKREKRETTFLD